MREDLLLRLKEIIKESAKVNIELDAIQEGTNLVEDFGFDSILMIEFILELEDEFNIVFEDDDMIIEVLADFNSLTDLILSKCN